MQQKSEMQQGWDFATQIMGADLAAHMGMEYVSAVDAAIKQLEENINKHNYRNLGIKQLQGFMLEEWGAGTFNVDAIAADSTYRAEVLHPGFPNNHTSIQESSNNYCYFWRASNGLTPRSRYSCSCFIRTSPCAGAFPGSR